ncbi:hypothetical protein H6G33_27705 [Calothrix sp. FACHB-1219]|uniref:hypothetical protein n=1 Tax=unclassified Calothrix TaxID=2619626 RepID=UPI0016884464|nr:MULTISPECIES: hypothetical protein [unclassified Calothrix]MBD2206032.1 hypothetical protein [Calothrix sp. FACHB-168]MBD2220793.1 hypothetical protein [Calothrix sp. FACHB-1219]
MLFQIYLFNWCDTEIRVIPIRYDAGNILFNEPPSRSVSQRRRQERQEKESNYQVQVHREFGMTQ